MHAGPRRICAEYGRDPSVGVADDFYSGADTSKPHGIN